MFQELRPFLQRFGVGTGWNLALLVSGSVVNAVFELFGVMLIFPLMSVIIQPDAMETSWFISTIRKLTGIRDQAQLVILFSLLVAVVYIIKAVFQIGIMHHEYSFLSRWRSRICYRMFQRFMDVDYTYHIDKSSSFLINLTNERINTIYTSYVHSFIMLISNSFVSIALLIFLFIKYAIIMVVVAGMFAVLFFLQSRFLGSRILALGIKLNVLSDQRMATLQQGIAAYKDTKVNLREKFFCERFDKANNDIVKSSGSMLFFQNVPLSLTELIVILCLIFAFDILFLQASNKAGITIDLGVLVMVVFRMVPQVNRALSSVGLIRSSQGAVRTLIEEADRIGYHQAVSPDAMPDPDTIPPLPLTREINLKELSFSYPGSTNRCIDSLSLTIQKGEFIGIIGPSGSGKTTLISLLLGFFTPDSGEYKIDDQPITDANIANLRRTIGYVDQQTFIIDGTIAENVAFGLPADKIDRIRVESALRQAELLDLVRQTPQGLDSPVGENGQRISGGQRQRLVLARALYGNPSILILDEATSALDVETEYKIASTVQGLSGQLTIIAIAHRLSTLKSCNRLVLVENGRITDQGAYADMLERNATFREMVRMSELQSSGADE